MKGKNAIRYLLPIASVNHCPKNIFTQIVSSKGGMITRSNFMRSKFTFSGDQMIWQSWDQIILSLFMRSKLPIMIWFPDHPFFISSKFKKSIIREFWSHDWFVSYKYDHEIEIQKALLGVLISWSIC
jgi:hypothetical protein